MAADYWLIKRRRIDVPALYDPRGRYRYFHGVNWQGLVAFLLAVAPLLPGLAYSINPTHTTIDAGAKHLYSFDWLFGFTTSIFVYTVLHLLFPWKESLVPETIDGVEAAFENGKAGFGRRAEREGSEEEVVEGKKDHGHGEGYGYANVDPIHRANDVRE